MTAIRFDFSKVNDRASLVPAGQHAAELRRTKPQTASTGTPGILFVFEMLDEEYVGKTLFLNMWYTQASMWRVRQVLGGFGVYTEEELNSSDFEFDPNDLIGTVVMLEVSQVINAKSGKMVNSVEHVYPMAPDISGYETEDSQEHQIAMPFVDSNFYAQEDTMGQMIMQTDYAGNMDELLRAGDTEEEVVLDGLPLVEFEVDEPVTVVKSPVKTKKSAK